MPRDDFSQFNYFAINNDLDFWLFRKFCVWRFTTQLFVVPLFFRSTGVVKVFSFVYMYDSKLNDAKSFMLTVHNLKTNQKSVRIICIPGAGGEMGINVM